MSDSGSLTPVPPSKPPAARSPEAEPPELRVVDKRWWARGEETQAEEPSLKPSYVEELERQLSEKDTLLQSYIAKYREAANEFEDSRVRLRREGAKDVERGIRGILAELLEVVDNLDRAIDAARQTAPQDALVQGVEMVRDQFLAKLKGFGVTRPGVSGSALRPSSARRGHDRFGDRTCTGQPDPRRDQGRLRDWRRGASTCERGRWATGFPRGPGVASR